MEPDKNNKSFKAGEVIQDWVKPLIKILLPDEKSRRCANCFKSSQGSEELKRCGACKVTFYCSSNCQKEDWEFAHRVECKLPLTRTPVAMFGQICANDKCLNTTVARTLAHFKLHPEEEVKEHEIYDGTTRSFSSLMAHVDSGDQILDSMAQKMSDLVIHKDQKWSAEYIRKIAGIWTTNRFDLMVGVERVGSGLFVEPSVFDHSCRPTATYVIDEMHGWRFQVRAIVDIPVGDKPLVTYFHEIVNRSERQETLKRQYNFECRCDLCEQEIAGPVADYEMLHSIFEKFDKLLIGMVQKEGATYFEAILRLRDNAIHLFSQVYHPYDERITMMASAALGFLLMNHSRLKVGSAESLSTVANDTLKRLKMTFGVEHIRYTSCKDRLAQVGIRTSE